MSGPALPPWRSVLAVVAHPDDESFGLGAVLSAFVEQGTAVRVLCLTRGEASTLHGVPGDLDAVRERELVDAAKEIGLVGVLLRSYPDGGLAAVALDALAAEAREAARAADADGIVAFDSTGVTGHQDHVRATEAALAAAAVLDLPVLGWTLPRTVADTLNVELGSSFAGHDDDAIDLVVPVDRTRQLRAVTCHASQAVPGSVLWRRLDLLAGREHLRWLTTPSAPAPSTERTGAPAPAATSKDWITP
ncbi:PIG-L family deacetylase [Cellulomonas sp. KRMCY2]|uniref:PIG-L family deacetylase n=1 Tax=Cellulomonas sp. KRMCY2 TaxID=1304865 RepID=UPI0004B2EBA7|nr:PIG-L deacetylase family protein [Cellulomonas sp. KRMCY2]